MNVFSRAGAGVAALAVCLVLGGCAADRPSDGRIDDESPVQVPTAVATATADRSADPIEFQPFLTLASVDPDGTAVSASGGVDGILENDGTCTFTFTGADGTAPVTTTSTSISDATNTSCGVVHVPLASFTSGTWQVVLSYDSASGTGASDSLEVVIP